MYKINRRPKDDVSDDEEEIETQIHEKSQSTKCTRKRASLSVHDDIKEPDNVKERNPSHDQVLEALCATDLARVLPTPICELVVEYSYHHMAWDMVGDISNDVNISNDGLTVRQFKSSRNTYTGGVALANIIFKPNTGSYKWKIKVDCSITNGHRVIEFFGLIGVINCTDVSLKKNLNSHHDIVELRHVCGFRFASKGITSCISNDIDHNRYAYGRRVSQELIKAKYVPGDCVTVQVDTDENTLTFWHNQRKIHHVIGWKKVCDLRPVIVFGRGQGTEQYTIQEWSWW